MRLPRTEIQCSGNWKGEMFPVSKWTLFQVSEIKSPAVPSQPLSSGRLPPEQEGLGVLALAADLVRAEVLVPWALRRFRLGFTPELQLPQIIRRDLAFPESLKQMVPECRRQVGPLDLRHYPNVNFASSSLRAFRSVSVFESISFWVRR